MPEKTNIIGKKFNLLLVLSEFKKIKYDKCTAFTYLCRCDCGKEVEVSSSHLRSNHTKSCGCLRHKKRPAKIINLVGNRYGKLLVLNKSQKISKFGHWDCRCDCGKLKTYETYSLKAKTSCGCSTVKVKRKMPIKNHVGKTFGKLKVISRSDNITLKNSSKVRVAWNCICECGNQMIVTSLALVTGNTRSCGCLKIEANINNIKLAHKKNNKYSPQIFSAREVWYGNYTDGISFDDFYKKSQLNCFYCKTPPSRKYNAFKRMRNSYAFSDESAYFTYNGLDRIDSNLNHSLNNVVSCCSTCNRSKSNNSQQNHKNYLLKIAETNHITFEDHRKLSLNINLLDLKAKYFGSSVKCTFNKKYHDGNLSVEQFYKLSQLNCYYCGIQPSNLAHKPKKHDVYKIGIFKYNGLDRIDNGKGHDFDNVVACCYRCNFAKSNLHITEFMEWINNIKNVVANG